MSIYKRPDSPFWHYRCEGTKLRVNTKVPVDGPTDDERKKNKQIAQRRYLEHMRQLSLDDGGLPNNLEKPRTWTFAELAAWYQQHELPKHRGAEREREILPRLIREFGDLELPALTAARVKEWISRRLRESHRVGKRTFNPPAANTVNREIDILKGILQAGVPAHFERSPLFGMKRLRAPSPKRRLMSAEEEAKLLAVMNAEDQAILLLGLDALIRLSDILDVKRKDDHGSSLYIADPKAGGGFSVPVSARLRAALDAHYAAATLEPVDYVFTRRRTATTERDRRNGIRQMLEYACTRAGLPYGRAKGGLTFHWATRRTGATRMLTRGSDPGTVQKVGRWKTASMVLDIYHELIDEDARRAVESVSRKDRA